MENKLLEIRIKSHNPCFSGKTFAIKKWSTEKEIKDGHNPCFSGKTFAMECFGEFKFTIEASQSLF